MANDFTLGVVLQGTDKLSPIFKANGQAAKQMGSEVESSLNRSTGAFGRISAAGAAWGAAAGAMVDITRAATAAYAESEAAQLRLENAIANTGASFDEYKTQIEAASDAAVQLGFDDEDLSDALTALTQATGDTGAALNDLTMVQDLARARNMSLADAAKVVADAEAGRMRGLSALGLGITATMSKEEAFAIVMEKTGGAAEEYGDSTAGAIDRVQVQLGNLLEKAGGLAAPIAPLVQMLPAVQGGYTLVSTAVGALTSSLAGQTTAAAAAGTALVAEGVAAEGAAVGMTSASVASKALNLALGPVGLAAMALAGTLAVVHFATTMDDAAKGALADGRQAADDLATAIDGVSDAAQQAAAAAALEMFTTQLDAFSVQVDEAGATWKDWLVTIGTRGWDNQVGEAQDKLESLEEQIDSLTAAQRDYITVLQAQGPGTDALRDQANDLIQQFEDGTITVTEFAAQMDVLSASARQQSAEFLVAGGNLALYEAQVSKIDGLVKQMNQTWIESVIASEEGAAAIDHIFSSMDSGAAEAQAAVQTATEQLRDDLEAAGSDVTKQIEAWDRYWATVEQADTELKQSEYQHGATARAIRDQARAQEEAGRAAADYSAQEGLKQQGLDATNAAIDEQNRLMEENGAAAAKARSTAMALDQEKRKEAVQETNAAIDEQNRLMLENGHTAAWVGQQQESAAAAAERAKTVRDENDAIAEQQRTMEESGRAAVDYTATQRELEQAWIDATTAAGELTMQLDTLAAKLVATGDATPAQQLAYGLSVATSAADDLRRVIIQLPDSIASGAKSTLDWATELVNVEGVYGRIDDLRRDFPEIFSEDDYNNAQRAYNGMEEVTLSIQAYTDIIQAKLVPYLADAQEAQADYLEEIAKLPPEQQLAALGYMDQAESAKALAVAQQMAAATTDEQRAQTEAMVEAMIAADPTLKAMLVDMGLIKENADGSISFEFENADATVTTLDDVVESVTTLAAVLAQAFHLDINADGIDDAHQSIEELTGQVDEAQKAVDNLQGATTDIPPSVAIGIPIATPTGDDPAEVLRDIKLAQDEVNNTPVTPQVDDSQITLAWEEAGKLSDRLDLLDGYRVTVYVDYVETGTPPGGSGGGKALGGVIGPKPAAYALGGSVALVGETGPEMVRLPYGAMVTPATATAQYLKGGGGGAVNLYGPVTVVANDPQAFATKLRARRLTEARA